MQPKKNHELPPLRDKKNPKYQVEPSQRKHIKNHEVRGLLSNIPNIDAFIDKRTANYIGKISRSNPSTYPRKFLIAWIHGKKKNGHPQLTCKNNYVTVIEKIMPKNNQLINKHALLKEWLPLALDENNWMNCIDEYFNSCHNIVNLDDLNPESTNEQETENERTRTGNNDSPEEAHAEVLLPPLSSPHSQPQNLRYYSL